MVYSTASVLAAAGFVIKRGYPPKVNKNQTCSGQAVEQSYFSAINNGGILPEIQIEPTILLYAI